MRLKLAVISLALCFLLPSARAAQPATGPADPREALRQRILRYVYELDSPDPAARDKAADELLAIGPEVIAPLKQVLAEEASPELRVRGEKLLAEIPRQWQHISPDGGAVCAGLQAILRTDKPAFPAGAAMPLKLEIRNAGPRTRRFTDIRGVDLELPDAKTSFTSPHADGRLVIRRISQGDLPRDGRAVVYDRGKRQSIEVKSGGTVSSTIAVDDAIQLPPGQYEAQFMYYAASQKLLADALDELRSNAVHFTVEAAGQ